MDRSQTTFQERWKLLLVAAVIALAGILLFWRLGNLTHGYSNAELVSRSSASSLHTIFTDPLNAPYKLLVWVVLKAGYHNLLLTRLVAASIALAMALLFYWIVANWYSQRIAFLSSILFVCSSGFLHIGRFGTTLILQMAALLLLGCILICRRATHETLIAYVAVIALALGLYIPGLIWFEALGLIITRTYVWRLLGQIGKLHSALALVVGIGLLTPLILRTVQNHALIWALLALPAHLPTLHAVWDHAKLLGNALVYRGYYPSTFWMHGAPLLNSSEVILFLAGIFVTLQRPRIARNYYLLGALVLAMLLVIVGGGASIAMVIPLVYLVIASGLYYLLDQWMTIFPRNPIARGIGVSFISILVVFSAYYHLQAYFIAWPQAPETRQVYIIKS